MVRPALGELGWGTWAVACLAIPVAKVPFGSRNLVRITRIPRCSVLLLRQVDHLLDVSQSLRGHEIGLGGNRPIRKRAGPCPTSRRWPKPCWDEARATPSGLAGRR